MLYNLCKDDNIFGLMFWGQDGWTKNIKEVLIMDKKQSANKLHNAINAKPCNGGFFYVNQITEGNFVIQKNDKELFYDGVEFVALNKSQIYTDAFSFAPFIHVYISANLQMKIYTYTKLHI